LGTSRICKYIGRGVGVADWCQLKPKSARPPGDLSKSLIAKVLAYRTEELIRLRAKVIEILIIVKTILRISTKGSPNLLDIWKKSDQWQANTYPKGVYGDVYLVLFRGL
jgi:hypothetical protein